MMEQTISQQLARFITQTTFDDIPVRIIDKAKRHILDTLGAGIAGAISDEAYKVCLLRNRLEGAHINQSIVAPLWGRGQSISPRYAAFANAIAAHAFELDDTGGCDHSGAVVIPAAFAALKLCQRPVTGKRFITAVILGYDMARRALEVCGAYEPHNEAGWHSTGTCGTFGAATAVGYLLGLNVQQMQWALGLAASFSGGLWAFIHDGAQSKRLHAGHAAEGGLVSATLAEVGYTGPEMIFENVWGGFSKTYALESQDLFAWTHELGVNWKLGRVSIKPHASCRSSHAAIDAVNDLIVVHRIDVQNIHRIDVRLNCFVYGMCGGRELDPMAATQMSIPYGIAARLVFGAASLSAYSTQNRHDPRILSIMEKIFLIIDEEMPADEEPVVTLTLVDGQSYTLQVPMPLGSPTNPVSDEVLLAKYRSLASMVLPLSFVDDLSQKVFSLEALDNMTAVEKILEAKPLDCLVQGADGVFK